MRWVIVANSSSCRIFDYSKANKTLTLIKELYHPESKLKGIDLVSDGPGHYGTGGVARGKYQPREEPQEAEANVFAREIAELLDADRRANQYKDLILFAPPHMTGLLQKHFNSHVKDFISESYNKDYGYFTEPEILQALLNNSQV